MNRKCGKVSILIPMYNAEKYISETINSCIYQTYNNIEIIIVDDGSSDNSYKIAEEYAKVDPTIFLYKQVNSGAPAARNLAFEKSSGEYIVFLDSDDVLDKNKILQQMNDARTHGKYNLYSGRFMYFSDNINNAVYKAASINRNFELARNWLTESWRTGVMGGTPIWMAHRDLITIAGPWNEKLTKNQDGEFFCRVVLNCKSIIYNENAIVYCRVNNNSLSRTLAKKSAKSTLYSYQLYEKNVENFINIEVKAALAQCYHDFINHYYPNFPELIKEAENSIERLGFTYHDLCRKKSMALFARCFGKNNMLIARQGYKKIRKNIYRLLAH